MDELSEYEKRHTIAHVREIGRLADAKETKLRAENARLREALEIRNEPEQIDPNTSEYHKAFYAIGDMQLCGHPVQAIRSTPYIGDQHSNYCGWCADIARFEREHELCQALTAELLEYRGRVARLQVEIAEERAQVATWMGVTKRAQADAARLREALGKAWRALGQRASVGADGTFWYCRLCKLKHGKHEDECPFAALSIADDWLARHDAEVRAQERGRCLDVIRDIADIIADDTPENMKQYGDADVVLLRTVMDAIDTTAIREGE